MAVAQIAKTLLFNFIVEEVCYPPYGCFRRDGVFQDKILPLPESPEFLQTKFLHHISENEGPQQLNIHGDLPEFRLEMPTILILHGFLEDRNAFWLTDMVRALLQYTEANVVVVDWKSAARFPYNQAIANIRIVGAELSHLLSRMMDELHIPPSNIHIIGFSLGAHLAGLVGKQLKKKHMVIGRITGLDPAGPYFEDADPGLRLDPTDAAFVDVIHTDSKMMMFGGLGCKKPIGHTDFYPNKGQNQPGCTGLPDSFKSKQKIIRGLSCSHFRAAEYFTESIGDPHKFHAYLCKDAKEFEEGGCGARTCSQGFCNNMGYHSKQLPGTYYLNTNSKAPYAAYHYIVKVTTGRVNFADSLAKLTFKLFGYDGKRSQNITVRSRYLQSSSTKVYLVHSDERLLPLRKIKVSHHALLWSDSWLLNKVAVIALDGRQRYIGCANKWLNEGSTWIKLKGPTKKKNRCRHGNNKRKNKNYLWWWG